MSASYKCARFNATAPAKCGGLLSTHNEKKQKETQCIVYNNTVDYLRFGLCVATYGAIMYNV